MEAIPKYKVGSDIVYQTGTETAEGKIVSAVPVNYHIMYQIKGREKYIHEDSVVRVVKEHSLN